MRQFLFLLSLIFLPCSLQAELKILVSIAPQKYLVERIAEDKVTVTVIVPQGATPHSYEPTPKQMVLLKRVISGFGSVKALNCAFSPRLKNAKFMINAKGSISSSLTVAAATTSTLMTPIFGLVLAC